MANDINMWNDIEDLESQGKQEQADALTTIHNLVFNEGDDPHSHAVEILVEQYTNKYGSIDNYF
jgi:adenylate cyclase